MSNAARRLRPAAALLLLSSLAACDGGAPDTTVMDGEAISADGVAIRYDVRGTGEPTLVLVHGWTNPRAIWGEHPNTLSRSHRVVALDLAGHGASGSNRADWTVDAFGADVAAVVDDLALEQVVLVGFSMGAAVVVEAAARLGDRVAGVVFVDALHDPEQQASLAETEQMLPVMRSMWGDTAAVRAFAFTPDAPDSLVNYAIALMGDEPADYWFEIPLPYAGWVLSDLIPTLQEIKAPIAAINATMQPTNVESMRRYAPSFTVDTMAGVGHAGILLQRVDDFDARLLGLVERFVGIGEGSQ